MPSHYSKFIANCLIIFLIGACVADEASAPPSVTAPSDEETVARLAGWVEGYLSSQKIGDPVETLEIVTFNKDLFDELHSAEITRFTFHINENHSYVIDRDTIFEYDGGYILNGNILGQNNMSEARVFVRDDGSTAGGLFVQGIGTFIIQPTNDLPHHIIYLRTGSYAID